MHRFVPTASCPAARPHRAEPASILPHPLQPFIHSGKVRSQPSPLEAEHTAPSAFPLQTSLILAAFRWSHSQAERQAQHCPQRLRTAVRWLRCKPGSASEGPTSGRSRYADVRRRPPPSPPCTPARSPHPRPSRTLRGRAAPGAAMARHGPAHSYTAPAGQSPPGPSGEGRG